MRRGHNELKCVWSFYGRQYISTVTQPYNRTKIFKINSLWHYMAIIRYQCIKTIDFMNIWFDVIRWMIGSVYVKSIGGGRKTGRSGAEFI